MVVYELQGDGADEPVNQHLVIQSKRRCRMLTEEFEKILDCHHLISTVRSCPGFAHCGTDVVKRHIHSGRAYRRG
jgi:acetolactate synthase regulatory subunit